jgi:hypothetical protein
MTYEKWVEPKVRRTYKMPNITKFLTQDQVPHCRFSEFLSAAVGEVGTRRVQGLVAGW